jgi:CheY-like chemotaxis protein
MKNSKWILVADDYSPIAELIRLSLAVEDSSCEIMIAQDGVAAMDCIHRRGEFADRPGGFPAFVLLDLKMPKVDGWEVLRQIKSDERLKNIPVIIFTSSPEPVDIVRCYQLGANAYVVKPIGFEKFNETLKCIWQFWAKVNELSGESSALPAGPSHEENGSRDSPSQTPAKSRAG